MLDIIATGEQNIYLTGDTHFNHGNIIKYCHRPFLGPLDRAELERIGGRWHDGSWKDSTASEWRITPEGIQIMNQTLIANINKTVPENATLIHVGDFGLWPKSASGILKYKQDCRQLRDQIKCRTIHMIWGNHDRPDVIKDLFNWSGHIAKIKVNDNLQIIVSHYCQMVWDFSHRGSFHCYGHSHGDIEAGMDRLMPGRRSMDVGVDNAVKVLGDYRPFAITEIVDRLHSRSGFTVNPNIPTDYKGGDEEAELTKN